MSQEDKTQDVAIAERGIAKSEKRNRRNDFKINFRLEF